MQCGVLHNAWQDRQDTGISCWSEQLLRQSVRTVIAQDSLLLQRIMQLVVW